MVTVEEALSIISKKTIPSKKKENLVIAEAIDSVLAEDIFSPIDMPPFQQSAMDGYAVNYQNDSPIVLIGEVAAGQTQAFKLKANEAVRIFTGAEVPETANRVIRQEDVEAVNKVLKVSKLPVEMSNIRPRGEQLFKGQVALKRGHLLTEASIAFLASIGVKTVKTYAQPKVIIISTGNELIAPGEPLKPGQIYDSNSTMLEVALKRKGYINIEKIKLKDDYDLTVKAINESVLKYDLIICSGGISVGDYDFIGKALKENDVDTHFYKVKQKPGKPLFFGQIDQTFVFGLPGNPAACLTCFYIYILPFLNKFKGGNFTGLPRQKAILKTAYHRKGNRAEFLKSQFDDGELEILEEQSSAMLKSFALANAITYIPISKPSINKGELVTFYTL